MNLQLHRGICFAMRLMCAAWLAPLSQSSVAKTSCAFNSVSPVSFGAYNVLSPSPNNNGVGSLSINCQGAGNDTFSVTLSTGQSHSYTLRQMTSGANLLYYNLYTSADRAVVWGDGTGTSGVMTVVKKGLTILSIFGQIPAQQDAAIGTYADPIVATVSF